MRNISTTKNETGRQSGLPGLTAAPNRLRAVAMGQMAVDEFADQRFAELSELQLSTMQP